MATIRLTVAYYYERYSRLKQDGTAAVGIQAYLGGKEKFFNAGIYVRPDEWSSKLRQVVHHQDQYIFNRRLFDMKSQIERFIYELEQMGEEVTLGRLKDYKEETLGQTFTQFYEDRLEKAKPRLSRSTYTDQRQTLEKFKAYRKSVPFRNFTVRLLNGFIDWLHAEGLSQNTVHKHFKNIRKYANLAVKLDYFSHDSNPCNKISVSQEPTERLHLTEHELKLFEAFEAPEGKEHLMVVKDFFLFACYTGLRFGDISMIDEECIIETPEGIELFLRAQKTKKQYRQNLRKLYPLPDQDLSRPEQILKRRLEENFFNDGPIFLYDKTQVLNRHLKTIAKTLQVREKIKREISSHVARHTFATHMASKVLPQILQQLLQHSNIRETMVYVHLSNKPVNTALDEVQW